MPGGPHLYHFGNLRVLPREKGTLKLNTFKGKL